VVFPLLRDAPFAKRLEVNGAVRYTDYSSSGPVTTWKVGLNWQPVDDVRVRFTESRDIRAPTLLDLYSGTTVSQINVNDPHTGVTGIVRVQGGGNADLKPEVARTTTAGVVYTPSWAPRLQVSVDYYNILISNAIATINGAQTAIMQECEASGGTSPLCETIVRPLAFSNRSAANFPTLIYTRNQNIAQAYTHGVDVEASYSFDLADLAADAPGRVDLRLLYVYQPTLKSRSYPGSPVTDAAGVAALSATRITGIVGYEVGPFSMDWQLRYSSKQERSGTSLQVYADPPLKAKYYADVNLSYRFKAAGHDAQAFVIVSNLFDTDPRLSPATNSSGSPGTGTPTVIGDDVVGRYYTVGLRMKY
jgi:outer membrane receptor protein involved in Fe transport